MIIWYDFVKDNYKAGNYTNTYVRGFVIKNKITPEEYTKITGEPYAA